MSKIQYLREYVSLAETLNFSKTSELMFIAQPALSRHIAAIEEEMGSKLFIRNTRNASLTDTGETVYHNFVELLKIYDQTKKTVHDMSSGIKGTIKISSPYYWTQKYTEALVQKIYSQFPNCNIKVLSCLPGEGYQDMINGKSDVAICFNMLDPVKDVDIRSVPFAMERICAFVDRDLELANAESLKIEDLRDYSYITLSEDKYPNITEKFRQIFISNGIKSPDLSLIPIEQVDTVGMIIHKTKKIGIMMSCLQTQNRPYLKCFPLENEGCQIPLYLYYRMDNHNPLIVKLVQIITHGL